MKPDFCIHTPGVRPAGAPAHLHPLKSAAPDAPFRTLARGIQCRWAGARARPPQRRSSFG
jgi:hypothetical protein